MAASSSNVVDAIRTSVENAEQAIIERVDLATLHEVDEALSMPEVGAVWRATQPVADATEQAVSEALDAAAKGDGPIPIGDAE